MPELLGKWSNGDLWKAECASVLSGAGAPAASVGTKGDLYVSSAGSIYKKGDTTWSLLLDILQGNFITASLGVNGYFKINEFGLTVQWGISGSIPHNTPTAVSFPVAFVNGCYCVTATPLNNGAVHTFNELNVSSFTRNSFTAHWASSSKDSVLVSWMAIGV